MQEFVANPVGFSLADAMYEEYYAAASVAASAQIQGLAQQEYERCAAGRCEFQLVPTIQDGG